MANDWLKLFDDHAHKIVSPTDKKKGAYVVNAKQKSIILDVGISPTNGPSDRILQVGVLGSMSGELSVSYYNAIREGAGRQPETRMGRDIVSWIDIGDILTIGRIGNQLFFTKEKSSASEPETAELGRQLAQSVDPDQILTRAKSRTGRPERRARIINDFIRDPYVIAAALSRANDCCEMPNCFGQLFDRDDDRPYLEVHHISPLSEGGDDTFENVAALCPSCHRELHFGKLRSLKQSVLRAEIQRKLSL